MHDAEQALWQPNTTRWHKYWKEKNIFSLPSRASRVEAKTPMSASTTLVALAKRDEKNTFLDSIIIHDVTCQLESAIVVR